MDTPRQKRRYRVFLTLECRPADARGTCRLLIPQLGLPPGSGPGRGGSRRGGVYPETPSRYRFLRALNLQSQAARRAKSLLQDSAPDPKPLPKQARRRGQPGGPIVASRALAIPESKPWVRGGATTIPRERERHKYAELNRGQYGCPRPSNAY